MTASIRLLPFWVADGPHQMAADEVMLESAVAGVSSVRLYSWEPPTLSLGYFQRHEDRLHDPRLAGMAWIRRATGGGAIVHDRDLTYGLALSRGLCKGRSPADWHCRIHHVLAGLLRDQRVAAEVTAGQRSAQDGLAFLCFAVPQPGDVILEGKKIIGGAQRLRAGALLQHGSIQLPAFIGQRQELARQLAAGLGWEIREEDWLPAERDRIESLAREKYSQDAWNRKR